MDVFILVRTTIINLTKLGTYLRYLGLLRGHGGQAMKLGIPTLQKNK